MAEQHRAWLLAPLGLQTIIVAEHEVQQYLTEFQLLPVPFTPPQCTTAIIWQDQIVPVLNLGLLASAAYSTDFKLVVLAYQSEPLTPLKFVALAVNDAPERIIITDDKLCVLPEQGDQLWSVLAVSCVAYQDMATPIISVAQLDSIVLRDYLEHMFAELPASVQLSWQKTTLNPESNDAAEPIHNATPVENNATMPIPMPINLTTASALEKPSIASHDNDDEWHTVNSADDFDNQNSDETVAELDVIDDWDDDLEDDDFNLDDNLEDDDSDLDDNLEDDDFDLDDERDAKETVLASELAANANWDGDDLDDDLEDDSTLASEDDDLDWDDESLWDTEDWLDDAEDMLDDDLLSDEPAIERSALTAQPDDYTPKRRTA